MVFDELGYLRLTDFGIARAENSKQSLDASGTPGYMAPEVLCKQMHSFEVDFYAIGIIAHELAMGKVLLEQLRDRTLAATEWKSEMLSYQSSTKLKRQKFRTDGQWKQLI